MFILSVRNNFPPVASAPKEGTEYTDANFNLLENSKVGLKIWNRMGWLL